MIDWAEAITESSFPRRSGMMVAVPAWRPAELPDAVASKRIEMPGLWNLSLRNRLRTPL